MTGYAVSKLADRWAVTALRSSGDETLLDGASVEGTPIRTIALLILRDAGYHPTEAGADEFVAALLGPLTVRRWGVLTVSMRSVLRWLDARERALTQEQARNRAALRGEHV